MQDIKQREEKMQEKRKNTPWNDFVKEMCSRYGILFNKNNGLFTNHAPGERMKLRDITEYEEARETFLNQGVEYNDTQSLRDNMTLLMQSSGVPAVSIIGSFVENAQFSDCVRNAKNVYLSYISGESISNVLYSFHVKVYCNNVLNSVMVWDGCDIVFQSAGVIKSYKIFYSKYIYSSDNIRFSSNMIGCTECLFCDGLTNASYCIHNQQLTESEYGKQKEELLSQKTSYETRYANISHVGKAIASTNCDGSFVVQSTNVSNGVKAYQIKNGRNIINVGGGELDENIFDCCIGGTPATSDNYFCAILGGGSNYYGCRNSYYGGNLYYCIYCDACSYCLGCIGLKNKSFCILNKQYTKEERFELANQIFAQMDKDGILGAFFPASMNPFYFNDTIAYLIDDTFDKEEIKKEGYLRRDGEIKVDVPPDAEVITTADLGQYQSFDQAGEWKINPEILQKVIKDEKGDYYKIVPMELDFLQKHCLPLPRLHRLDRIKLGFKFK